jgi:hypothetical protein
VQVAAAIREIIIIKWRNSWYIIKHHPSYNNTIQQCEM